MLLVAATAWATLLQEQPAGADTAYVSISGNAFAPDTVQVRKGPPEPGFPAAHAHVQFVMSDPGTEHNVTFDDPGIPPSRNLATGQIHDAVFTVAGTYTYRCTIHPTMRGTVVVTELPVVTTAAPPATDPPATAPPATAPPPPPSTAPATAATTAPRPVARPGPTAATTVATTAPVLPTTPAPPPPASDTTVVPDTSSTTTTTAPPDTSSPGGTAAAASSKTSSGSAWPAVAVVLVLLGAAAFTGRRAWSRHTADRAP